VVEQEALAGAEAVEHASLSALASDDRRRAGPLANGLHDPKTCWLCSDGYTPLS
jgi:hypothetical protein